LSIRDWRGVSYSHLIISSSTTISSHNNLPSHLPSIDETKEEKDESHLPSSIKSKSTSERENGKFEMMVDGRLVFHLIYLTTYHVIIYHVI